jgi:hypothetical protein
VRKEFLLLFLLLLMPFSLAAESVEDHTLNCDKWFPSWFCSVIGKVADSTNIISEQELEDSFSKSNTVQNLEKRLLEEDISQAKLRVVGMWDNILSIIILFIELFKIIFYVLQLFVFLYIPFLYVKVLLWVRRQVESRWRRRARR